MAKLLNFRNDTRGLANADSVAVIGLGRFGESLALELMKSGTNVLGIDTLEQNVQALNGELTQVVRADASNRETLEQLSIQEFDRVVVAVGSHLQSSILCCSLLVSMGIPQIWAKAQDDRHGLILKQLGIHHIVYPEKDMGKRVAHLVRGSLMDYLEVDPGYAMVKMTAPAQLHGVKLSDAGVRNKFRVTIAATTNAAGEWVNTDGNTVLHTGDRILVLGSIADTEKFGRLP
ncbi:potassium channel family protein [Glutamicibacter halophytocola]|uniref:potassium channel family protein n=1 Tax=Glutamicibacter halophytocola TaxID=1933880 RepID=UPI001C959CA5|nr:TrkA family potassium uptake protein [Glutamicibacter halophytocola]